MKRVLLILALFALAQQWQLLLAVGVDYDEAQGEVILLSTKSCGYCARTRRFLKVAGVPYRDVDVEHSEEGRRRMRETGAYGVPVLIRGDQVVHGYDPGAIRTLINNRSPDPESG